MKIKTLRELMIDELQDLHSAEQQIVKAFPRFAKASHNPSLKHALEQHVEETRNHLTRLENIFKRLNQNPGAKTSEGMKGLLKEGEMRINDGGEPDVLDAALISAVQRIEHYEIAAYGSVRTYAELLGDHEAVRLLNETWDEEKAADAKLNQVARAVYVEAKAA